MIWIIIAFVGGCFVGWHVPQPAWVKTAEDKITGNDDSASE